MTTRKRKYQRPVFLNDIVDQETYEKWLQRKSQAHIRRDKKRGNDTSTLGEYKLAIHKAVVESEGRDAYTGEVLDWHLISTYDNEESKLSGREYKRKFTMLPSVDHVGDGLGVADFKICSWRINDSKSDMTLEEYVELCRRVIYAYENP